MRQSVPAASEAGSRADGVPRSLKIRRVMHILATAGLFATALAPAPALATDVWLSGVYPPPRDRLAPGGNSDFMALFDPNAPWLRAASHVAVFKAPTLFFERSSDEELSKVISGLRQRHIALAMETLMQTADGPCGQNVEGYSPPDLIRSIARRIRRLGGELNFVAMDEPLWFGHHYDGLHACHSTIPAVARNVAKNVAEMKAIFPNIRIGDIEPLGGTRNAADWLNDVAQWIAAYRATTGENLAFFHVDMVWGEQWHDLLGGLAPVLAAAGIRLGIIYDGDPDDQTGVAWAQRAEQRFAAVESDPALIPAQAIIQSWVTHPVHNLPETQPGTMTWLVNRYLSTETSISLQPPTSGRVSGRLAATDGAGIAGQRLRTMAVDVNDVGPLAEHKKSGTVPEGASRALFILRLNAECRCSGPVDVTVGALTYRDEDNGQSVTQQFSVHGAVPRDGGLHIVAASGTAFTPNTAQWPVRPGHRWTAQVALGASATSAQSGYVAVLFLRADGKEARRDLIQMEPATFDPGEAVTDASGNFSFQPSLPTLRLDPGFKVKFPGNDAFRMSEATLP